MNKPAFVSGTVAWTEYRCRLLGFMTDLKDILRKKIILNGVGMLCVQRGVKYESIVSSLFV